MIWRFFPSNCFQLNVVHPKTVPHPTLFGQSRFEQASDGCIVLFIGSVVFGVSRLQESVDCGLKPMGTGTSQYGRRRCLRRMPNILLFSGCLKEQELINGRADGVLYHLGRFVTKA